LTRSVTDPIPTWLLKVCASVLTPTITNIVDLSLTSGQFHPILRISYLCTSPETYSTQITQITIQPYTSKIIERVVKCRLTDHPISNGFYHASSVL